MIKKMLIGWGIVSIISIFIYSIALASPGILGITYTAEPGGGLFNQINIKPLDEFTKEVTVKNNSSEARVFALRINDLQVGKPGDEILADALTLKISRGGATLLTTHLADLLSNPKSVEEIPGGATRTYNFKVTLDNVGNEYQGREITSFNYVFGFEGEEGEVAGEKDEGKVLGEKDELPATGSAIGLVLLLSLMIFTGLKNKSPRTSPA